MMLQMLGVFAEFERATLVERITAGMERAASQARWISRRAPYGYVWNKETKMLVPNTGQAEIVRRIFAMYTTQQMGADAIGHTMGAEAKCSKNGVAFVSPAVLPVLANPLYVGSVRFREKTYPGFMRSWWLRRPFEAAARILSEGGESQALRRGHRATICSPAWCAAGVSARALEVATLDRFAAPLRAPVSKVSSMALKTQDAAGFGAACVHQIGPDQHGSFEFYEKEVLPSFR